MKKLWLLTAVSLVSGCAAFSGTPSPVYQVVEPSLLKDCKVIGSIKGPASNRMWGTPYSGNFRNDALKKAESMGGTHVLTRIQTEDLDSWTVIDVYKCPESTEPINSRELM